MDLTHAIMFTKKIQELFYATGTGQTRQNRPGNWLQDREGMYHNQLRVFKYFADMCIIVQWKIVF